MRVLGNIPCWHRAGPQDRVFHLYPEGEVTSLCDLRIVPGDAAGSCVPVEQRNIVKYEKLCEDCERLKVMCELGE